MDIAYDLDSLKPLPLESDKAEVIFNSFLLEHMSWDAIKNLVKDAYRSLKKGGVFHSREFAAELYKFIEKNY
mgnify:CR=1 FL=1